MFLKRKIHRKKVETLPTILANLFRLKISSIHLSKSFAHSHNSIITGRLCYFMFSYKNSHSQMAFFTHACEACGKVFTAVSNYFGKVFLPKNFFNTFIKIICACSVG